MIISSNDFYGIKLDLNDNYDIMLKEIMKNTGLDQEDAIKFLIAYYYKTQC